MAALALPLAGCVLSQPGKPDVRVALPKAPAHYAQCFTELTGKPIGPLTSETVVRLIADLRMSEKRKSQCGKDLLDWYARVRLAYGRT